MAYRKGSEMKYPLRAAPPPPTGVPSRSPSWSDDLFANDPFANRPDGNQKKKPPPRPPPPKFTKAPPSRPDVPQRPPHFNRKPTILSSLIGRKAKPIVPIPAINSNGEFQSHITLLPPSRQSSGNATAALIDFSSPPSSPTLTTRSSSDGLSVDSFGSDITSSTGNGNPTFNGGNISQAESGFEDDFDLFSGNKNLPNESDPISDSWAGFDPFSPPKNGQKVTSTRPVYDSDFLDPLCNGKTVTSRVQTHNIPTIIRAKPARPKTPKNSALLSTTLTSAVQRTTFNAAATSTLQSTFQQRDKYSDEIFDEGDYSPPMPSVPPPPPPAVDLEPEPEPQSAPSSREWTPEDPMEHVEEPYGIALFDFPGTEPDDLPFRVNDKIRLLRQMNEGWMLGRLRSGMEGMFPANFIEVKVPLGGTPAPEGPRLRKPSLHRAVAMYDFAPQQTGDLGLTVGCVVNILAKVNDEWLYGEVDDATGQFPASYIDHVPCGLPTKEL